MSHRSPLIVQIKLIWRIVTQSSRLYVRICKSSRFGIEYLIGRQLGRKHMKDREVDLDDEVWGIGHMAKYMGQSEKSMYKLVAEPGFPTPLHSQSRNRRWLAEEVRKFLFTRSTRTLVARNTNVSHMSDYQITEPKNFSFKKTKEAVR